MTSLLAQLSGFRFGFLNTSVVVCINYMLAPHKNLDIFASSQIIIYMDNVKNTYVGSSVIIVGKCVGICVGI